jgi:uncharacterized protein (TIGR02145 family)
MKYIVLLFGITNFIYGWTGEAVSPVGSLSSIKSLAISAPAGGENWKVGDVDTIKWTSSGVTNAKLEYTTDAGTSWITIIASTTASTGSYLWTTPNTPSTQCKVRISDASNSAVLDTSNGAFAIYELTSGASCPGTPTVTYAGKIYHTVLIGTQCWLRENLNVGTKIAEANDQSNNSVIEKYCYNNDTNNCNIYGGLYQWAEAVQYKNGATNTTSQSPAFSGNIQGICPSGWHIPTYIEYQTLDTAVNFNSNVLKAVGQGTSNGAGTNTSGFSALLAGYRNLGYFASLGEYAFFWSSSDGDTTNTYSMLLYYNDGNGYYFNSLIKKNGFSVRCVMDSLPTPTLQSPTTGATDVALPPTLTWNVSAGATKYTLQIATNSAFISPFYNDSTLTTTTKQITGLVISMQYYWRVRATNTFSSSSWSSAFSFTTGGYGPFCPGTPTVTYSGKTYNTVLIGNQCWLKENLDVGTRINGNVDQSNNSTIEKYCYNDDPANCTSYGGLYQWAEVVQYKNGASNTASLSTAFTGNVQGICPTGWHIPTNAEFQACSTAVQGDGNVLKGADQGTGSGAGTNASGFSTILVGYRNIDGSFSSLGRYAYFWSSIENTATYANFMYLSYNDSTIGFSNFNKSLGYSVRCLLDSLLTPTLQSPSTGATNVTLPPTLTWNTSTGATKYTLQVSTNNTFSSLIFNDSTLASTKQQLTNLTNSTLYYWRVRATNAFNSSAWSNVWNFATQASTGISLTAPAGGESWQIGSTHNITWTSSGVSNVKIEYSTNSGTDWQTIIASTTASSGSFSWTVPNTLSTLCKVRISDVTNSALNSISGSFTIYQPTLSLTSPVGGEKWQVGSTQNITWACSYVSNIKIEYSSNSGTDWQTIIASTTASGGSYSWPVPNTLSTLCKVRISDVTNSALNSISGIFTIYQPTLSLTSPVGGEKWQIGSSHNITWASSYVANVKIEYSTDSGSNWLSVSSSVAASSGSYSWTVSNTAATTCKVKISDVTNTSLSSSSSSVFTITAATVASINITSPAGSESWKVGSSQNITWSSTSITNVKIEYSTNGGTDWQTVAASITASLGTYSWTIPVAPSTQCNIRLSDVSNASTYSVSGTFTIFQPALSLTSPAGGEQWLVSSSHNITWTSSNVTNVKLEYSSDNGTNWSTIAASVTASTGTYAWALPSVASVQYKVRVSDVSNSTLNSVSNAFAIYQPFVTLTSPAGGENWQTGSQHKISWTSQNVSNIMIAYSTDNGSNWQTAASNVAASTGYYIWTAPSTPSTSCKIKVTDVEDSGVSSVSSIFTIFQYPATINTAGSIAFTGTLDALNYKMVSVPGSVSLPVGQIMSGEAKKDWDVFYDNGASSNYLQEYDGSSTFDFKAGHAFWMLTKNSTVSIPSEVVNNLSIDTANVTSVVLDHSGWNLISNPFAKIVDWTKVLSLNGLTANTLLYKYSGGSYSTTTQMVPYEGYYFNNSTGISTLKMPYNPSAALNKINSTGIVVDKDKSLRILVKENNDVLSTVYAAIDETSDNDYEVHDYFAPPEAFEQAGLRIRNEDITPAYKYLWVDSRPMQNKPAQEFNIEFTNNSGNALQFLCPEIPSGLSNYEIALVDNRLSKLYDLKTNPIVPVTAKKQKNTYRLVIGTKEYIEKLAADLVPKEYKLLQNYPNPFNPNTVITFQIPKAERVNITVYDLLGKQIKTLINENKDAGRYEIEFNAGGLSSGVYIYKIRAGKFSDSKKLILMK